MIGYNKNEIIGKMRERVILQNRVINQSNSGFQIESYSNVGSYWTSLDYKTGFEEEDSDKIVTQQKINFTLRYNQEINTNSRLVYRDSLYQIEKIEISNDRRFVVCTGVYRSSYTGSYAISVGLASTVSAIATSTANIKLLMSVIGQANAIASAIGEITTTQQGVVEMASSVVANATSTTNVINVISINSSIAASANVSTAATIVQYIATSINAQCTSIADALLSKTLNASVQGNATSTSALDVISQGITSVDASVTATGTIAADILRIATLQSSPNTTADTTANATLTKVLEASATATAQTSSDAQLTLSVNASATATANTSADAQLSYTVNAAAIATAQTNANAFITRIISAQATATANSSAEAGIGVTFVAAAVGVATSTNADLFRTATMSASATASGSVTAASITTVDNVAASVSGTATQVSDINVLDGDAAAFFARVTTAGGTLTSTEQSAVNTLVKSLKSNAIWSKMKAIYPMVGASAAACAQNLKSSSFTGTFSTGWTFASTGITGNGTSAYFDTTFNPNTSISDINSSHLSIYSRTTTGNNAVDIGVTTPPWDIEIIYSAFYAGMMDGNYLSTANADAKGLWTNSRISSSSVVAYRNGSTFVSGTNSPTTKPNYNVYIGARNDLTVAKFFSNREFAFASIGDGLTNTEAGNFYTAIQAFQTTLNRQV